MPRKIQNTSGLTDEQISEIFAGISPTYRVKEEWLEKQRIRLKGAVAVSEEAGILARLLERLQLWWEELPYLWLPARPILVWSTALVLGILVGRFVLTAPAEPGLQIASENVNQISQPDLADLIRSGQLEDIDVNLLDDPENPVELNLTMGQELKLTGAADREDILAALEYVLVKDPNPGQRLQSARILGEVPGLENKQSATLALLSALLTDDNTGVRLSALESLKDVQSPLIKDALVKIVLEDENDGVRLAAVENLTPYLDDLSVRSALLLVSRMDPVESIRFQAYQVLSQATEYLEDDERLESEL